ncbi:MAG: hypothetical protein KIH89_001465 [Candidatus Shapirobacteria bacterium]|nr:hypothetical protein [Candidatus Shapirobacteria bacterium]
MKYLFTVLAIFLSWTVILIIMPLLDPSRHLFLYFLAIINTFVLYLIGFKNN